MCLCNIREKEVDDASYVVEHKGEVYPLCNTSCWEMYCAERPAQHEDVRLTAKQDQQWQSPSVPGGDVVATAKTALA